MGRRARRPLPAPSFVITAGQTGDAPAFTVASDGLLGWCVVADVARETAHGEGGLEIQHGTRHFAARAKLWIARMRWDPGHGRLHAVGHHRGNTRRYVNMVARLDDGLPGRRLCVPNPLRPCPRRRNGCPTCEDVARRPSRTLCRSFLTVQSEPDGQDQRVAGQVRHLARRGLGPGLPLRIGQVHRGQVAGGPAAAVGHVQAELGQLGRLDDRSHQEHQEPHRIQEWAVVQQSDGSFEIVNRKSDKLLDDYRWATASGSAVVQWADNDGANQHWTLTQTALPALTTGDYTIQNNLGKYLEIPGGSTASGMQADQWWYADQPWHLWHFVSANGGFRIINNNSGLALTDTHPASGEKITQAAVDSANANQIWTLVPHGNQFLVQNAGTGRCVTVAQGSSADLAKAVSWTETDTSDQLWTVRRIN